MKAVVFDEIGLPTDVLALADVEVGEIGDDEVLVRMLALQSIQVIFSGSLGKLPAIMELE